MNYINNNHSCDEFFLQEDFPIYNEYEEINNYFKNNEFIQENFQSFDEYNYFQREVSDNARDLQEKKNFFDLKKQKDDFLNIINNKNWKEETKKKFISLIKEYEFYLEKNDKNIFSYNSEKHININDYRRNLFIEPNDFYTFLKTKKNYNGQNLHKIMSMILTLIKVYYDKNLYEFNFENKKIFYSKINITNDDFFTYVNYLKKYNKLEDLIILELIVKYKINIGGISNLKIKKKSLNKIVVKIKNDKEIIISDKNIINRLKYFIKKNSINKGEYLFYNSTKKKYIKNRENYCVKRFKNNIDKSKIFLNYNGKSLSSESFRKINLNKIILKEIFYKKGFN